MTATIGRTGTTDTTGTTGTTGMTAADTTDTTATGTAVMTAITGTAMPRARLSAPERLSPQATVAAGDCLRARALPQAPCRVAGHDRPPRWRSGRGQRPSAHRNLLNIGVLVVVTGGLALFATLIGAYVTIGHAAKAGRYSRRTLDLPGRLPPAT